MSVLFRAITYATVFVGVLLIYLPARILVGHGACPAVHDGRAADCGDGYRKRRSAAGSVVRFGFRSARKRHSSAL